MQYFFSLLILFTLSSVSAQTISKQYITVADSKVYVQQSGAGKALILLHAGNWDHRMWKAQTTAFSKYFRVIVLDLRGCGSTVDGDSTYLQSEAILTIMNTLQIETASFVGLSLGSVAATAFALAHPGKVDKLILASPGLIGIDINRDFALIKYTKLLAKAKVKKDTMAEAEAFVKTWVDGPARKPAEVNKNVRATVLNMVYQNIAKRKADVYIGLLYQPTQLELLPALKKPVLVIAGKKDIKDILTIAEVFKKNGAKVVLLDNAAHMVNLEQPAKFNHEVLMFLKGF